MTSSKTLIALLLAFLFVSTGASAKQRTFSQARAIARQKAHQLGLVMTTSSDESAKTLNAPALQGQPVAYYVFPADGDRGFVIVSGDDRLPEVVGYSDRSSYDPAQLSCGYRAFLAMYADLYEALSQDDPSALETVEEAAQQRQRKSQRATISPLLGGRQWNQYAPFNDLCPLDGDERSFTGCVATALAQVFAYWRHPEALKVDIPAYTTHTKSLQVPTIAAGEPYAWDDMIDNYNDGQYTEAQGEAVAKLMLHCGAALQMDYTNSSSGASIIPACLVKYFGYNKETIQQLSREDYDLSTWMDMIDNELAAGRPVLYSGKSTNSGHQFVCDGADGNGLYHINWGWGGYQDGYFDITLLNPQKGGAGSGDDTDGYNKTCFAIMGLCPGTGDDPVDPIQLVSARSNAESGLYEKEQAVFYDYHVEAPKTSDGVAIFTYGVKNNGEATSLRYSFQFTSFPNRQWDTQYGSVDLPGEGAVTSISATVTPDDMGGDRSILCSFRAYQTDSYDYLPTTLDEWKLFICEPGMEGYSYRLDPAQLYVYVAGDASGVADVHLPAPVSAKGGQGELLLQANCSTTVPVFSVDGRKQAEVAVVAGVPVRVPLRPGVYLVMGNKVVVR